MGRSVSSAAGAIAVVYEDVSRFGYAPEFDDNGDEINPNEEDWKYDEWQAQCDWDCFVDTLQYHIDKLFPSMVKCEKWLANEDKAIMENNHAYIGISEYCGVASIWLVNKAYHQDVDHPELADAWCEKVKNKFLTVFGKYVKITTLSNGEAIYERKA